MVRSKIPAEFLQKLKEASNLVDIVSEHVVLRKSGSNYVGLCPFHSERSPSFSVSEQKQLYHCYGCKKGGDLLSFVMEIHTLSFPEALEELAARAKLPLPSEYNRDPEGQKKRDAAQEKVALAHKLNRFAAAFYHQNLSNSAEVGDYLKSRGVTADWQRAFYLGAAPHSWDALAVHLNAKKAPLDVAVEVGLIRPSTQQKSGGVGYFDLFRNRAMFPILDNRGRVAGFGGRLMSDEKDSPKYLNSQESLLFQKSKLLYGFFQAQKHIREQDEAILVEGYFDVLAMHAAGFQNVVATCGTALTPDHLKLLLRLCNKIVILFDGDKAGISATERAMELGLEEGLVLYGAAIPEGLDPDELLFDQNSGVSLPDGITQMRNLLGNAGALLDSRIEAEVEKAQTGPEAKTLAVKQISNWLTRFKDPVGKSIRIDSASKRLGVSRMLIDPNGQISAAPQGRGVSRGPVGKASRPVPREKPPKPLSEREKVLLGALAKGGKFSDIFFQARFDLPPKVTFSDLFDYSSARDFVTSLFQEPGVLERFRAAPEMFLQDALDPQVRSILTEALISQEPLFNEEEVRLALGRSIARAWAQFSQRIRTALASAEANKDAGLQSELMKEYLDVQRKMKEFNLFYDEA